MENSSPAPPEGGTEFTTRLPAHPFTTAAPLTPKARTLNRADTAGNVRRTKKVASLLDIPLNQPETDGSDS